MAARKKGPTAEAVLTDDPAARVQAALQAAMAEPINDDEAQPIITVDRPFRPPGAYIATSKKRAQEVNAVLLATGISPLEMIMNTARELYDQSNAGPVVNFAKRMQACALAEKALPFLHPRLTSVSVDANVKRSPEDFDDSELEALAGDAGEDPGPG